MKILNLLLPIFSISLSGCLSTYTSEDIEKTESNASIEEISLNDSINLTYRFKDSLVAEDQETFYSFLGTPKSVESLSSMFDEAVAAGSFIAGKNLWYSQNWEKALLKGDILELVGGTALVGVAFAAITPSIEHHKVDYYFNIEDEATQHLSAKEATTYYRKLTYKSVYEFAEQEGYDVECNYNCTIDNSPDDKRISIVYLKLKENAGKTDYFKPLDIQVILNLQELKKVKETKDAVLLGNDYTFMAEPAYGWIVLTAIPKYWDDPKTKEVKYVTNDLGQKFISDPDKLAGTKLHQKLYEKLTTDLPGYSHFYNNNWRHLAFYDGKTFKLNETLIDNSIIEGQVK